MIWIGIFLFVLYFYPLLYLWSLDRTVEKMSKTLDKLIKKMEKNNITEVEYRGINVKSPDNNKNKK